MALELNELDVYNLSASLSDDLWSIVNNWDKFSKNTVGKQLVRSVDSISANISEGYGRYAYKENIVFCYYARGSLIETRNWLDRALQRKLIDRKRHDDFIERIEILAKKQNAYISAIKKQISKIK